MKTEGQIRVALKQKLSLWLLHGVRTEKLRENIRFLDWVLRPGLIRDMDAILIDADAILEWNRDVKNISLCQQCYCMTKTVTVCGKCKLPKKLEVYG